MLAKIVIISALAIAGYQCLDVDQCEGHTFKNLEQRVKVKNCKEPPCPLIKGTNQVIYMTFTPEREHENLSNDIVAKALGLDLPFIGVTGTSACNNLFLASDPKVKASCPVKAHTEYLYKNTFPILPVYPNWNLTVHWALITPDKKTLLCFELPVAILNAP